MPRPPRAHPAPVDVDDAAAVPATAEVQGSGLRAVLVGGAIGFAVAVASIAIAFSIIAIPLFIVASTEPGSGLDRTLVRRGLFQVALPFGLVAGTATGIAVGIWYGRGGRLPRDRTPIHG